MDILSYITDRALILVPVLLIIEKVLWQLQFIKPKYIPLILLPLGIAGAVALSGLKIDSVIQGILVTGAAVYAKQIFVNLGKKSGDTQAGELPDISTQETDPQQEPDEADADSEDKRT